jgi:hypothetical protein
MAGKQSLDSASARAPTQSTAVQHPTPRRAPACGTHGAALHSRVYAARQPIAAHTLPACSLLRDTSPAVPSPCAPHPDAAPYCGCTACWQFDWLPREKGRVGCDHGLIDVWRGFEQCCAVFLACACVSLLGVCGIKQSEQKHTKTDRCPCGGRFVTTLDTEQSRVSIGSRSLIVRHTPCCP